MNTILIKRQAGRHNHLVKVEVGCKIHDNCFTCPYPEGCIMGTPEYHRILGKIQMGKLTPEQRRDKAQRASKIRWGK